MAIEPLVLVINPSSSSKKYALIRRGIELITVAIKHNANSLLLDVTQGSNAEKIHLHDVSLGHVLGVVLQVFTDKGVLNESITIDAVAIKIVAPSAYFLEDRIIAEHEIKLLQNLQNNVPHRMDVILQEITEVHTSLPGVRIVGISDSAFHLTKPDYTWNYGINLADADKYDIKRFGYQGIMLTSVKNEIKQSKYARLSKTVVCHLGDDTSVTALYNGKSIDTTTGYTSNEGMIMPAQSGTLDFVAGLSLARQKNINPDELARELYIGAGLYGISGSSGAMQNLLDKEAIGDHRAALAACMYVYAARQAIARMVASLEGIDMLVFTGTIGQGSPAIRERIVSGLAYLGIIISNQNNNNTIDPNELVTIQPRTRSKPVVVIPINEERVIASRGRRLLD